MASLRGSASRSLDPTTATLTEVLIAVGSAAVAAVLLLGLINMIRGGNPWRSQYLMQMRVLFDGINVDAKPDKI
jgi:hypothetical protein